MIYVLRFARVPPATSSLEGLGVCYFWTGVTYAALTEGHDGRLASGLAGRLAFCLARVLIRPLGASRGQAFGSPRRHRTDFAGPR